MLRQMLICHFFVIYSGVCRSCSSLVAKSKHEGSVVDEIGPLHLGIFYMNF